MEGNNEQLRRMEAKSYRVVEIKLSKAIKSN